MTHAQIMARAQIVTRVEGGWNNNGPGHYFRKYGTLLAGEMWRPVHTMSPRARGRSVFVSLLGLYLEIVANHTSSSLPKRPLKVVRTNLHTTGDTWFFWSSSLIFLSVVIDENECRLGTHNCDSDGRAKCTNNAGSISCRCHIGYQGDGHSCRSKSLHMQRWRAWWPIITLKICVPDCTSLCTSIIVGSVV